MATPRGRGNILKFVNADDSKEVHLRRAADVASEAELDVIWIPASDVVGSTNLEKDHSVFVLDPFEGECFDYLKSEKCRIFGPQCVISCLETRTSLPSSSSPTYSVSMVGVFACCSSIAKHERQQLHSRIQLMGGVVIRDFTDAVTHLIAGEVGSKKYVVACSEGKKVMLPDWVHAVWQEGKDKHVVGTDEHFDVYKCPIFKGCTISVTGLDGQTRQDVKRLCSAHGGIYSGELNMNTCTHLLVNVPKGDKYEFARKWSIHCVSTQWFYDCIKAGCWLDESIYHTLVDDESNLSQPGSRLHISQTANSTVLSSKSKADTTGTKAAQAAYKSAQTHGDGGLIADGNKKARVSSSTLMSKEAPNDGSVVQDLDLDFNIIPGCMFLDGCKIFLSGFSSAALDKLRKAINAGGGTRFNMINEIVSHVVIGAKFNKDLEVLQKCEMHPFVVTGNWIIDSAKNGKQMPEEDYIHPDFKMESEETPTFKENKKPSDSNKENGTKSVNTGARLKSKNSKQQKASRSEYDDDELNDDEVFLQYTSRVDQQTTSETALKDDDDDTTLDDVKDGGLLAGHNFVIIQFLDGQVTHLKELIESHGGEVVSTEQTADYAVLPMNAECHANVAKEIVTFCWLEQCLQDGELFDLDLSFLFRPFIIPKDIPVPLHGCVLTISQYVGVERDHLMQLAELLGATCQEHFVHKANRRYLGSTHLLCQEPQGSKFSAALKWNIPVTSREWLFACAKSGSLQPVEDYPVSFTPATNVDPRCGTSKEDVVGSSSTDHEAARNHDAADDGREATDDQNSENVGGNKNTKTSNLRSSEQSTSSEQNENPKSLKAVPNFSLKQPFRPSFDVTDAMEALESPLVPSLRSRKSRASRNSFPLDDFFQEHIQQAVKRTGNLGACTVNVSRLVTNEQDHNVDNENAEDDKEEEEVGILHGVILAVSKKLSQQQTELYGIASSLGADYRWVYDNTCTHLVHQGRTNDTIKDYTNAKERGIYIVSSHWLHACAEANTRLDEKLYPHTYNPKMSLQGVTKGKRMTRSSKATLDITIQNDTTKDEPEVRRAEKPSSEERNATVSDSSSHLSEESRESNNKGISQNTKNDSQVSDPKEDLQKQIENFISATKGVRGRRRSRRQTSCSSASSNSHNSAVPSCEGETDTRTNSIYSSRLRNRQYDQTAADKSVRTRGDHKHSDEGEHSQSDTITYDDPAGRLEREKIMARLQKGCSPSPDLDPDDNDEDDKNDDAYDEKKDQESIDATKVQTTLKEQIAIPNELENKDTDSSQSTQTPEPPPLALQVKEVDKPTPQNLLKDLDESPSKPHRDEVLKFQLSAMTPQEKMDYSALIEQLGGQVFDTQYFKTACSHVVVGKPNRNEKYLAAIAAGKWVLHKSYLEDSRQAGHFVDEESHEWGTDVPGEQPNKLAIAARRWRLKLKEQRKNSGNDLIGAFSGWRVLLCVDKLRQSGFKRLLEAGGAQVVGSRPPFNNIENVSHAFIDYNKMKPGTLDIDALYAAGIWLVKPDYIAEFLMQDPEPHPGRFLIPEAAKLNQSESNTSVQRKRKGDDLSTDEKRMRIE